MKDPRCEVKMVCEELALPRVLAELRLHPMALSPSYPDRVVQSIYLDTHAGRAVAENLAGVSQRAKFRVRWYGAQAETVRGTLERKRRENQLGDKARIELPRPIRVEGVGRRDFLQALASGLPAAWQDAITGLEPVQWIRYLRSYFVTGDRRLRVTVDRELRAIDLRNESMLRFRFSTPMTPLLVLECKAAARHAGAVEEFARRFPLRIDKCSMQARSLLMFPPQSPTSIPPSNPSPSATAYPGLSLNIC